MTTHYKLGTISENGHAVPALLIGDRVYLLSEAIGDAAPQTLLDVFKEWSRFSTIIGQSVGDLAPKSAGRPAAGITMETPVARPSKVVCVGANYRDHLREMKVTQLPEYPYSFLRPVTCLAAHGQEIRLPTIPKMVDWEAELGVIIGSSFGPDSRGDPMAAVAGYTVVNDISARDWIANKPFVGIDWVMQKSWDNFQPTGPWITPAEFVADAQKLPIGLWVNGIPKQQSNTSEMIFGVREIIKHLGAMMTLEPGDVIATGTPNGVGYGLSPQEFIKSGNSVRVTIEGLGTLENKFI
ncbi:fumarylacetoacetate hydrolase family protein [Rhizobium bangladeshense]|uniref:Fumarylacetoacetate hydrolase family protein n=1 Tax=Rhizobium bangladeshense TaxID=1138189 RepID=A0ABS7LM79_9HYPH|nr:fumarylacetoacetate hydrolase family protein [Rhizobium bangladeshense]MBY3592385.1 fumarylacetoacetate hydrolase family protein [Rhizobium bangladeshense]